ncbi:MAG TPA: glycosyltransferase family 4 protein [Pyrinomonadaceae bacterium]|nr:glycosyltransferase family 4 protein [Pyrinomonadaceae bacterium]
MKIFVLTDIPSPYQTEIFNQIAADSCDLHVGYLRAADPSRQWSEVNIKHPSTMLDRISDDFARLARFVSDSDLAVFNYYRHPHAEKLLCQRANEQKPWCFWGERPGFRKPEWVGRVLRHWKLKPLRLSSAPIWGIGKFAVDQYRREFGAGRAYLNLPYFSNLDRFRVDRSIRNGSKGGRVFMFSGALTRRKGVDILARAFEQLARDERGVFLRILGDGPLRSYLETILAPVVDRVQFLGFKDWSELPQHYATADVLCVPSRYDGWGLVVPEGLASGLPVIATDQMGAALEFVETRRNGWLVQAGNQSALLGAMREAATISDEDLSLLSSNAQESVREHSLPAGARRFLQYASEAVANWRG